MHSLFAWLLNDPSLNVPDTELSVRFNQALDAPWQFFLLALGVIGRPAK